MAVAVSREGVEHGDEDRHEQAEQQGVGPEGAAADEPHEQEGDAEDGERGGAQQTVAVPRVMVALSLSVARLLAVAPVAAKVLKMVLASGEVMVISVLAV